MMDVIDAPLTILLRVFPPENEEKERRLWSLDGSDGTQSLVRLSFRNCVWGRLRNFGHMSGEFCDGKLIVSTYAGQNGAIGT